MLRKEWLLGLRSTVQFIQIQGWGAVDLERSSTMMMACSTVLVLVALDRPIQLRNVWGRLSHGVGHHVRAQADSSSPLQIGATRASRQADQLPPLHSPKPQPSFSINHLAIVQSRVYL
jgi:hypothetical protein